MKFQRIRRVGRRFHSQTQGWHPCRPSMPQPSFRHIFAPHRRTPPKHPWVELINVLYIKILLLYGSEEPTYDFPVPRVGWPWRVSFSADKWSIAEIQRGEGVDMPRNMRLPHPAMPKPGFIIFILTTIRLQMFFVLCFSVHRVQKGEATSRLKPLLAASRITN